MEPDEKKFFEDLTKESFNEPAPLLFKPELIKASGIKTNPIKEKTDEDALENLMEMEGEGQLTVDVFQNENEIIIQSTIAGVNQEDLEININAESVSISGQRHREEKISEKDYFYQECFWGRFSRSVILPQEIDPEHSTAQLKNGVLTIRLPKVNREKTKKIKVKFD
ncbi:MAG: Hsp20/alpha crystallin family protein [Candidatus Brennerbacteria bacterium]|nr:Hsp20/alpha crystallin family protein [Candidatus Brennerbacteria bacterium]